MPLKQGTDYARWRVISLASRIYLLMGLHIAHWKIAGKDLAPLEFNEVLYIHLGILTAKASFYGRTMVSHCSSGTIFAPGCAICLLFRMQRLDTEKPKIKPRHIRSRTFYWIPVWGCDFYSCCRSWNGCSWGNPLFQFILRVPQAIEHHLLRQISGEIFRPLALHFFTFLVCGGFVVYVLGAGRFVNIPVRMECCFQWRIV